MQNLKSKFKIKIISKTFYLLLVFLTFEFLFLNLDKANAASLSLAIDPPIIVINAIPPTTISSSLNIQNKSDIPLTLQIQLKPFKPKGENGELEYLNEPLPILKNIQILDAGAPINNLTLDPQQQKNLSLNITVPSDTTISDYYFSILFVSTNPDTVKSNSSINQIGIATNVLLSVGALETPSASLEEFSSKIFFEKGPVPFTVRVKSTGTHSIKPTGEITIKNMFGQSVGKLDLYPVNILSDSIRAIATKDSPDFLKPTALWNESFLLGFYTATLKISMSAQGPVFVKSVHFLAFPLLVLIIIVVAVITAIITVNRVRKYMNKSRTAV